jgi:hypothetical protein
MLCYRISVVLRIMIREVTMRFGQMAAAMAAGLLAAGAVASDVAAQGRDRDGEWVELGCQKVSFRAERDTIRIGRSEGRFSAIRLFARGGDVEMRDLKVIYAGGQPDDIQVRRNLERGERTRPLDLRGRDRAIGSIEMVYRALPNRRDREPTICIEGLLTRAAGPGPGPGGGGRDWVELGCQQVSLIGKDRDTIRVGRREGRFKSIRLLVRGADVEVIDLKVIYSNGAPDDIPVKHLIRAGERTRPLDLRGRERSIDRIDMVYRTNLNPLDMIAKQRIRNATVCVEGLD